MDKLALLSLSNDLKRITISIQRGSMDNSKRFQIEAQKWLKEASLSNDPYLISLLKKVEKTLELKDDLKKAEDCLMYTVLLQNQALYATK